jgi:hypothetical protein
MARPSKYNQSLGEEILSRYSNGETLTKISMDKHMPKRNTIYRWRRSYPEFGEEYLLALEQHADALVDMARDAVMTADSKTARLADVQQRFLTWNASKLNRAMYGEKIEVSHSVQIDIAPQLQAAMQRMSELRPPVIDVSVKQLVEGESDIM